MASGEVHLVGNLALGAAMTLGAYQLGIPVEPMLLGAAMGTIITPDYDLEGRTITESALRAIPVFGFLWQWSWYGYAMLFEHRGLSHNFFIGTLSRVIWWLLLALFWGWIFVMITEALGWGHWSFIGIQSWQNALLLYCAWWAQDLMHYALDL